MQGSRIIYCDYLTGDYYHSFMRITNNEIHIYLDNKRSIIIVKPEIMKGVLFGRVGSSFYLKEE
jgi:hypothetical protein